MTEFSDTPLIKSDSKSYAFILRYREEADKPDAPPRIIIDLDDVTAKSSWRYTALEPALARIQDTLLSLSSASSPRTIRKGHPS